MAATGLSLRSPPGGQRSFLAAGRSAVPVAPAAATPRPSQHAHSCPLGNILPARGRPVVRPRSAAARCCLPTGRLPPPGTDRLPEGWQPMTSDTTSPAGAAVARNVTLGDLAAMLRDQQARKVDIVAPATAIRAAGRPARDRRHRPGSRHRRRHDDHGHLHPDRGVRSGPGRQARHPGPVPEADARAATGHVRRERERLAGRRPAQVPRPLPSALHRHRPGSGAGVPTGTSGSTTSTSSSQHWTASGPPGCRWT